MIVMDASAAILGLLNDGDSREHLRSSPIACPHLIDAEVAHVLRRQVLREALQPTVARRALTAWAGLGIERLGIVGLLDRVWELRENLTAYDAAYVAVAEALGAPLVTADARLAQAPGPACPITVVRR